MNRNKKIILSVLASILILSFAAWATNTTSSKNLVKFAADCSTYIAAGELCIDTAANVPYLGDGLTALRVAQLSGSVTDGHISKFNSSGQIIDGGTLAVDTFTTGYPGVVCKDSSGNITKCANLNDDTLVGWRSVSGFTAAPNSTSTLTIPDITSWAQAGLPIKFAIGETTYYAQITALTTSLMTIAGAPFSGNVDALAVGGPDHIAEMVLLVPGNYEASSSNTVLLSTNKQSLVWHKPEAAAIKYTVFSNTVDTGSAGKASVYINGNELNTSAGGLSIANAQTTYSTVVDIDAGNYTIAYGQPIEITATKGGNGDAADLTVHLLFVIK